jgi:hypothetical protein
MKRIAIATFCVLMAIPVVWAVRAEVDYAEDADFSKYKTFQFFNTEESSIERSNPLMHARLVSIIEETLIEAGLEKVDSDPDLFVTYHATTEQRSSFSTTGFGYGWGGGYRRYGGGWGGGTSTTVEHVYTEGTLLVDAWDAETEKLVWRGSSSQVLKTKAEKQEKQLRKAVEKMAKKWEKIKKKRED